MDTAPAFASVSEAIGMARAALGYLAAADAAQLAAQTQAECLQALEQTARRRRGTRTGPRCCTATDPPPGPGKASG